MPGSPHASFHTLAQDVQAKLTNKHIAWWTGAGAPLQPAPALPGTWSRVQQPVLLRALAYQCVKGASSNDVTSLTTPGLWLTNFQVALILHALGAPLDTLLETPSVVLLRPESITFLSVDVRCATLNGLEYVRMLPNLEYTWQGARVTRAGHP